MKLAKASYHHGNLADALVFAARDIALERGVEAISVAEAARRVGVSPPALYRHFKDRAALIHALLLSCLHELGVRSAEAYAKHPRGSMAAIVALCQAYLRMGRESPELFDLLTARRLKPGQAGESPQEAIETMGVVRGAVNDYLAAHPKITSDPEEVAMTMWSICHGVTRLVIEETIQSMSPDLDPEVILTRAIETYFGGLETNESSA